MILKVLQAHDIQLPCTPEAWLEELHTPTAIEFNISSTLPWRIISVLVHGNEPSGFFSAYKFIQQKIIPKTNVAIVIASVRAARHEQYFLHRHIPGEYDLNRRFGSHDCHDRVTELALEILDYIRKRSPEYLIDLHNTSGNGPSFGVSIKDYKCIHQIASLFVEQLVVTQLNVGSLMEQNLNCPIVTIECGGARSESSHILAFEGLCRFTQTLNISELNVNSFPIFYHPVRVQAHKGISLDYSSYPFDEVDITLIDNIEDYNIRIATKGTHIAWLDRTLVDCLSAIDEQGKDIIQNLFVVEAGIMRCAMDLKIFMATKRADIALSDCLFYVVRLPTEK